MSKLFLSLSTQPSHCNLANPGKQKGRPSLSLSFSSGFQRLSKTSAERLEYGEGMCDRLSSGYWIMSCHHTPRLKDVLRIWVSNNVTYCPEGWNLESVYVPPMWKSPKVCWQMSLRYALVAGVYQLASLVIRCPEVAFTCSSR